MPKTAFTMIRAINALQDTSMSAAMKQLRRARQNAKPLNAQRAVNKY